MGGIFKSHLRSTISPQKLQCRVESPSALHRQQHSTRHSQDGRFSKVTLAPRVQVPNHPLLTQNLYYNYVYPKPTYLILGYMDPLGCRNFKGYFRMSLSCLYGSAPKEGDPNIDSNIFWFFLWAPQNGTPNCGKALDLLYPYIIPCTSLCNPNISTMTPLKLPLLLAKPHIITRSPKP